MKRVLWFVVLLASFLACESPDNSYFGRVIPRHPPDELWFNNSTEAEYIDPGKCSDANGGEIIWNTFAGLVQAHPQTLRPLPDIAERWTISTDRTRYTFFLKATVWSDGTPLTAQDFEWSWKRVLDPMTGSRYASAFYPILNARPVHERAIFFKGNPADKLRDAKFVDRLIPSAPMHGVWIYASGQNSEELERNRMEILKQLGSLARRAAADDVAIRAIDARTIEVQLESAIPYFLDLVSTYTFMPVPKHVIERLTKAGINPDAWTDPKYFVSNGAYVLTEWRFRREMVFRKNPRYWDADTARLKRVRLLMVEKDTSVLNFYKAAEIDWSGRNGSLPLEFADRLASYRDFSRDPFLGVYFYWVNTKAPPMDNVNVRRALDLAIDRESIVKFVTRARQVPTADFVPNGLAGYDGLKSRLFDPVEARRLLKSAGYETGEAVPPITLIYNTSEGHKAIAEAIQQMWKKELGIRVQIENQEWKVFLNNQAMKNFQISRMGWVGDYPDPYTFLEVLLSSNGNNASNWGSRVYDNLLDEANRMTDPGARLALLKRAEGILKNDVPLFPVYVYTRNYLMKPYLKGHWANFQDRHPWKYMWIDERWYRGVPPGEVASR